ncbi:hypothetical protein [Rubrobacter calidifluminis]|uniref:hypothetical protein n=1 Tax=Rubrobacter calidifluminis TaxID=1392640 RepID=UPI00235F22ED|nr:hypothetical protein [Rubrobacter calidifluminis]
MTKRGYTRETIRGAPSEWDVSRPLSSYLRLFGRLVSHPLQFFEVLPKLGDVRAPALFLAFSGLPAAVAWFFAGGIREAAAALLLPLPLSLALGALYHLGSIGGRFGYLMTWRTLAYPLGYLAVLSAVPGLRWVLGVLFGAGLIPAGLRIVQEVPLRRILYAALPTTAILLLAAARVLL